MTMGSRRKRGQAGVSLIEALLVLALTSGVILVIALGIQTAVTTDGQTSRIQRSGAALTSVTEALRSADVPFAVCPTTSPTIEQQYERAVVDELRDVVKAEVPVLPAGSVGSSVAAFRIVRIDVWSPPNITASGATGGSFSTTSSTALPAPGAPSTAGQCLPSDATALRVRVAVTLGKDVTYGEIVKRKPLDGEAQ